MSGPRPRRSLRSRIVWTSAVIVVAAMSVMAAAVVLIAVRLTQGRVDSALRSRVVAAETTVRLGRGDRLALRSVSNDEVIDTVWIFDRSGRQLRGPKAGERVLDRVDALSRVRSTKRTTTGQRAYLAEPIRLGSPRRTVGVVVATENLDAYVDERNELLIGLVALGLTLTAGAAVFTRWTVGRTLRPVEQMTTLAGEWSEHDLDSRFARGPARDELGLLANTLDSLLDRVAQAIRSEQRLSSELAHELRTPLTTIRAEAELGLLSDASPTTRERMARVVEQVDRLDRTITTLLAVARHESDAASADPGRVIQGLLDARSDGLPVDVALEPGLGPVAASPELVERVLGPVLDNAVRFAASRVSVSCGWDDPAQRRIAVRISDDGPGFDSPASESDDSGGAGLGLPLARRVGATIGGEVTIESEHDPTTVLVRLPVR